MQSILRKYKECIQILKVFHFLYCGHSYLSLTYCTQGYTIYICPCTFVLFSIWYECKYCCFHLKESIFIQYYLECWRIKMKQTINKCNELMKFWMETRKRLRTSPSTAPAEQRLCVAASLWLALTHWQMSELGKNDRTWDGRCLDATVKLHIWPPCGETRVGGCGERQRKRKREKEWEKRWCYTLASMISPSDCDINHIWQKWKALTLWNCLSSTTDPEWTTNIYCIKYTPCNAPIVLHVEFWFAERNILS